MNGLKRLEPITKPEHEFKSCDEFDVFYSKNKDLLDSETTHKLNKKYKIPGYKITRRTVQGSEGVKSVLCLKKLPQSVNNPASGGVFDTLDTRMTAFEQKLDDIVKVLNAIVDKMNSTNFGSLDHERSFEHERTLDRYDGNFDRVW